MSKRQSNIRLNWQYFWRRNRRGALLLILAAVLVIGLAATAVWRLFFRSAGDSGVLTEAFGVPVITEWIPENTPGPPRYSADSEIRGDS